MGPNRDKSENFQDIRHIHIAAEWHWKNILLKWLKALLFAKHESTGHM